MLDLSKIDFWGLVVLLLPGLMLVQGFALGKEVRFKVIGKDDLVVYPVFGLIYGLCLWLLGFALHNGQSVYSLPPSQLIWVYLVIPAIFGFLAGGAARLDLLRNVLRALGFHYFDPPPPPPPIRTPWPMIAPKIVVGTYLMVILKDKTIYRALVTEDSLLSSDQDKIDLYLGQTFEGEGWIPSSPQKAVYIRGSEIQSIEIWSLGKSAIPQDG
jgi:Family of unknown function (DUF6338)